MKRVLQVIILALLCLTLVFISKARLDLALTIVPEAADDGGSGETVDTLAPEASPTATPEPTPEPEPEYFTISCIGDMTLTTNQYFSEQSSAHYASKMDGDYGYPFANTLQYFSDDELTLGNLECSFSDKKLQNSIYAQFYFLCPAEWIQILPEGGVDFVTIANNHTMDFNDAGLEDTKAALDSIGMAYGEDEQAQIITTPSGIKMGIYTAGDGDSIGTGSTNIPDKDKALAAIADFESQGVDYIVCMFHWGSELKYRPTDAQVELAHACIDAGADLIYGSHSHCLQPLEEYKDGIILYSMGNWSFGGNTSPSDRDTAIVQVTVKRDLDGSISRDSYDIIPCCVSSLPVGADNGADNDYRPTPYEEGSEEYLRTLSKLDGSYQAGSQGADYSGWYASYGGAPQ